MCEFLMSDVYLAGCWIMAGVICHDVISSGEDWFEKPIKDSFMQILFYIIAGLTSWLGVGLVLAGIRQRCVDIFKKMQEKGED